MNTNRHVNRSSTLLLALSMALLFGAVAPCVASWDYGNGRHGSFVLTTNTTIEQLYQTVRLTNDPAQYNPADSNAIPNFQTLIITNGATLTANPWDGNSGGRIVLKVQGNLSISTGSLISVSGIGYRGGGQNYQGQFAAGIQGESYAGTQIASGGANYGGGGGGVPYDIRNNQPSYSGAGGGGYGESGGSVILSFFGELSEGGGIYGTATMETNYLGSGGGGYPTGPNVNGGNGGGAVSIDAGNIEIAGQIQAIGANGNGGSGGGSGGSIGLHVAKATLGTNQIAATGGSGNGWGGNGGAGRIMMGYAESFSGTTTPGAYVLLDTNSDNVTVITNQPFSQVSFLGSNAIFSVGPIGFTPLFFHWNFNNIPIPGATNQTLSLFNLDFTNQGHYSVSISNIVGTVVSSNAYLSVLDPRNPFGDGIPNWWKTQYGLSLTDPRLATECPPGDRLNYLEKYLYGLNPLTNDTDGDGVSDYDEIFVYHSNPLSTNTAGDGIPDGWKVQYGQNPSANNANNQVGATGVTYLQVYQYNFAHTNHIDPRNPFFSSGTSIYEALNNGHHTNRFYYDHEDRLVGAEYSRGVSIAYQYDGNGNLTRQTVLSRANETNGLPVLWQFLNGLTNGTPADGPYGDRDGDGWNNYQEWLAGTNPTNSQSIPSLLKNPGTSIASLALPFTPSNFVVGVGQLDNATGDEFVVGGDGNPNGTTNSIEVLINNGLTWTTQKLDVGNFGVTSIAVGQLSNRPAPAIYTGLRQVGGRGRIREFMFQAGMWVTNDIALSSNEAAFVIALRPQADLLASTSSNGVSSPLCSLQFASNIWNSSIVSSNNSSRGLGASALLFGNIPRPGSVRLLDTGGIEVFNTGLEFLKNRSLIPTNAVYNLTMDKWYFATTSQMVWADTDSYFSQIGAEFVTITSAAENDFVHSNFPGTYHIGLYGRLPVQYPDQEDWIWSNGDPSSYRNWSPGQPCHCDWNGQSGTYFGTVINSSGQWDPERSFVDNEVHLGIGQKDGADREIIIPESPSTAPIFWRGVSLATGFTRPGQTNGFSLVYVFTDDQNQNGQIDAGDDFVLSEFVVKTNAITTNTFARTSIGSVVGPGSYGLAVANYLNNGTDVVFTASPDGTLFDWTPTNNTGPLVRQMFTADYVGKAWHSLAALNLVAGGQGLLGLMVDP